MLPILHRLVLFIVVMSLSACSSGGQWQHPTKTIHEFAIDDRECQQLALARAKEASLVPQPVLDDFMSHYDRCLLAQGWRPLQVVDYTPVPVEVTRTDNRLTFKANRIHLTLPAPYTLLTEQPTEFLAQNNETYLYLLFQLNYPAKLIRELPPKIEASTFFDHYQQKNVYARFFSQHQDNQLIFACSAYLFADDHNRIVVSFSKAFVDMPENTMELTSDQFAELRSTQRAWEVDLQQLAQQLD